VEAQRIILCQLLDISTAGKAADTMYNEPQLLQSTNNLNQQQQKQLKELFSANSFTNQNFSKELPCPFLLTDENPLSLLDKTTIDIYCEMINPDAYGNKMAYAIIKPRRADSDEFSNL